MVWNLGLWRIVSSHSAQSVMHCVHLRTLSSVSRQSQRFRGQVPGLVAPFLGTASPEMPAWLHLCLLLGIKWRWGCSGGLFIKYLTLPVRIWLYGDFLKLWLATLGFILQRTVGYRSIKQIYEWKGHQCCLRIPRHWRGESEAKLEVFAIQAPLTREKWFLPILICAASLLISIAARNYTHKSNAWQMLKTEDSKVLDSILPSCPLLKIKAVKWDSPGFKH